MPMLMHLYLYINFKNSRFACGSSPHHQAYTSQLSVYISNFLILFDTDTSTEDTTGPSADYSYVDWSLSDWFYTVTAYFEVINSLALFDPLVSAKQHFTKIHGELAK